MSSLLKDLVSSIKSSQTTNKTTITLTKKGGDEISTSFDNNEGPKGTDGEDGKDGKDGEKGDKGDTGSISTADEAVGTFVLGRRLDDDNQPSPGDRQEVEKAFVGEGGNRQWTGYRARGSRPTYSSTEELEAANWLTGTWVSRGRNFFPEFILLQKTSDDPTT